MTVATSTNRISYTGDGTSTAFAFPYLYLATSDLQVYVGGVLQTSGYSVSTAGSSSGGTVTFYTAPGASLGIEIVRVPDFLQSTDLSANDPFPADTVERMADKAMLSVQRVKDLIDRSVRLLDSETAPASMQLPTVTARAGQALGFDALGQPVAIPPTVSVQNTVAPETGGISEQISIWIQRERLHPAQFGCSSGTGADQTANMQKAINAASSRGMPLNLQRKTWRLDGASQIIIPVGGLEIENGYIYGVNSPAAGYLVSTAGALGTAINVTSSVALYATTLQLTTTAGRTVGERMLLRSADMWCDNGAGLTVSKGEWVTIKSIDSGVQVSLTKPTQDSYATTIRLYPVSLVDHLIMTDMHFTGAGDGANQYCLQANFINDVRVYNSDARKFAATGFAYGNCPQVDIDGGMPGEGQDSLGLSYGHVISGATLSARAQNVRGDRLRHVVTAGGSNGVVRGYRVEGIYGDAMTDATVDAHPAVDDFTASDIRHAGDPIIGTDGDGIVSQARHTQINDYYIMRPGRHGILVQPACRVGKGTVKIGKGVIRAHGSYTLSSCPAINFALDIANNSGLSQASVDGLDAESTETNALGINFQATYAGCDYSNINARISTPGRALYVNSTGGSLVKHVQVVGGYYERTNTSAEAFLLQGASLGDISFAKFHAAHIQGGSYGIRGINTSNDMIAHMSIKGYLTAAIKPNVANDGISNGVNGAIITAADNQT